MVAIPYVFLQEEYIETIRLKTVSRKIDRFFHDHLFSMIHELHHFYEECQEFEDIY